MDVNGSFPSGVGLRRIALRDLEPDLDSIIIIAIIINKQTPRKFAERNKENEQYRAVWNFTLRDSQRDYINVTFWGPSEEVCATNEKFYTGDVVEIRNPRINVRKFSETSEQFCPMVTSPFSLTISDHSQVLQYNGDTFIFTKLLNYPTKPLSGYVPLRDIHNGGGTMKERIIDILGAIRNIGPVKNIKTKNGEEMQIRETIIFDHTNLCLRIALWDTEIIMRAANWKPRQTILFITDAKIVWSSFLNTYSASVTRRSIITENPVGEEAATLANYARSAPLETVDMLDQFIMGLPDPESIQKVMCVQQVHNKVNSLHQKSLMSEPFTALMFVVVTQMDLDGPIPITRVKCSSCKSLMQNASQACENPDCSVTLGAALSSLEYSLEIKMNLSDHTGTLIDCRLSGSIAEQVLNCSVQQFLRMSDQQRGQLKWKYLMERCAVKIVLLQSRKLIPRISVVSCSRANPVEMASKIPLC